MLYASAIREYLFECRDWHSDDSMEQHHAADGHHAAGNAHSVDFDPHRSSRLLIHARTARRIVQLATNEEAGGSNPPVGASTERSARESVFDCLCKIGKNFRHEFWFKIERSGYIFGDFD